MIVRDARAVHVRHIHKESFVRLDISIAVDGDREIVCLLAGGNCLGGQTARCVIAIGYCGGAILRGDVEGHAAGGSGLIQAHCENECGCLSVAFVHGDVVDA